MEETWVAEMASSVKERWRGGGHAQEGRHARVEEGVWGWSV